MDRTDEVRAGPLTPAERSAFKYVLETMRAERTRLDIVVAYLNERLSRP